jgi:dephospho-CoA kinase
MLHVGLTGNIASGKSSAALFFAELGAHVIDADHVVHLLLQSGTPVYRKIVDAFGERILNPAGEIDRRILGRMVFSDADKRLLLNSLTHPAVESEVLRQMGELEQSASRGIIIVDAALMIETGGYKMFHRIIVVTCDPALQVSRLITRDGLTEEEAGARIASQMPMEEKLKFANYTIDASRTLEHTREQVEVIYRDLLIQELKSETLN